MVFRRNFQRPPKAQCPVVGGLIEPLTLERNPDLGRVASVMSVSKIKMLLPLVVALMLLTSQPVVSQRIVEQPCPDPESRPIVQNFDLDRYVTGKWYEILRYDQHFERGCDCGFATLTPKKSGSIKVENCCERLPNTTLSCSVGRAFVSFPDHVPLEGKLNVTFGGPPLNSNYWIMDTDYDNYAIIYSCKNLSENKSAEAAWVLSKQRTLEPRIVPTVDKLVEQYLVRADMRTTEQSQSKCKYDN